MKFPFLNSKKADPNSDKNNTTNRLKIIDKLQEQLPFTTSTVKIKYKLICIVGRDGDKFAAKLAETGDVVYYNSIGNKQYCISGITQEMIAVEEILKNKLLEIIENGEKFNCTLSEWSIE